jgi:hypothetical protein
MIIAGFYAMSFGFATPPNIFLFLGGLCIAVLGLFLVIIFSTGIEMPQRTPSSTPKSTPQPATVMKKRPRPVKVQKEISKEVKRKETIENIEAIKPRPRIRKPKKVDRPDFSTEAPKEKEAPKTETKTIGMKEIKPKKKADIGESTRLPPDLSEIKESVEEPIKEEPEILIKPDKAKPIKPKKAEQVKTEKAEPIKPKKIEPVKTEKVEQVKEESEITKKIMPRIRRPKIKKSEVKPISEVKPVSEDIKVPEEEKKLKTAPIKTEEEAPKKPPMPKRPQIEKLKAAQVDKEDEYVKKRLDRLKESYIQNAKDIESIIDERLDSFKGKLGKLKSESREPGIIWSFDAGDVQEAMTDIISKANSRILMMYPWIRNIDVSILKKFMDTESSIIVQEASLDDDASVELLKLLIDKNVKVRTMPHVHTITIVADDTNGLIISTDPIYESYEVGVIYKDQKSIEEIENLFADAWEISQDVDLETR